MRTIITGCGPNSPKQTRNRKAIIGVLWRLAEIVALGRRFRRGEELDGAIGDLLKSRADMTRPTRRSSVMASRPRIGNRRRRTLLLLLMLFGSAVVFWPYQETMGEGRLGQGAHRAVLIDSLSQTDPDPFFISNVTQT